MFKINNRVIFWIGIVASTLFIVATILGGILIENYNPVSQYISESYAIDTKHGKSLRYFGFIPSGLLLTFFLFMAPKIFPKSQQIKIGFMGLGIFYGIATLVVSVFPCDAGCNREFIDPGISQLIHNLAGLLTYLFVPICILLIGFDLRRQKLFRKLSTTAIICGIICISFIGILFSSPSSEYAGLFQRIVEGTFVFWVIVCAFHIKKQPDRLI